MNKLKDTRVFGDLIVDDSITKNNKEVATEEYVDTGLSAKQDKLTLGSGQVLGRTTTGNGSPEAIDTVNINQIKVSDLDDGDLYALEANIPTKVSDLTNDIGFTTNKGTVTNVSAGTQVSGLTLSVSNGTTTPTITTSISNAANFRAAIGAGTSNLTIGTTATTAKAGNYQPTWSQVTGKPTWIGSSKPTYTAGEVGAAPSSHSHGIADVTGLATQRLLGRYSTGTGNVQPITLGSNLTLSTGGVLSATNTVYTHPNSGVTAGTYRSVTVNSQGHVTTGTNPTTLSGYGISLTGDVTNSGNAITIGPKKVTFAKMQDIPTGKVLGRTTTGNGSPEAIDTVNINQIKVSDLDDGDLYAKTADIPTKVSDLTNDEGFTSNIGTVTQVKVGSTSYNPVSGVISLPAYPTVKTYSGSTSITLSGTSFQRAALTGDVTASANSNTTTIKNNAVTTNKIDNNAVTLAKIQEIPTNTVLGRTTGGTGVVEELDLVDIGEITPSSWTQVWSGAVNLNAYTNSFYTVPVPTNTYIGKRIAIEVQYSSGTTYTSKIIFGVLGSSSAYTASTTVSKGIGWNYFDGTYLRIKTLFVYTPAGTRSSIYVGRLKTLFGKFSGTTIEWKTSHSETLYMKKIWVIN